MNDPMPRGLNRTSASARRRQDAPTQPDLGVSNNQANVSPDAPPWTVTVEISLPGDTFRIHKTALDRVLELLRGYGPVIWDDPERIVVAFGVSAPNYQDVQGVAATLVMRVTQMLGLPAASVGNVGIDRADAEPKARTSLDARVGLVGLVEAAAILGVSKQRVAQLAHRPDFPKPVWRLRATPIWRAQEIRMFEATRRDAPGVRRFPRRVSPPPLARVDTP